MTQWDSAQAGTVTAEMAAAAAAEDVAPEDVCAELAKGHAVLPANPAHTNLLPTLVGRRFRVKVNANIGRSPARSSPTEELEKVRAAMDAGADFVMDLSVGPELASIRKTVLQSCPLPLGTVPIYEAFARAGSSVEALRPEMLLSVIEEQAREGVDFMTLHAGILREHVAPALDRTMGIVSRGGSILAEWMERHDSENPFYTKWDEILAICAKHDVTVSLGDGLRPGCLADASDEAQFAELAVLGRLVARCREKNVQVMVEGPGHIPFDQIQMNMEREQDECDGAPFYVLGPVVTDIAPGYDHITACIGATEAAYHGAALLCYVTPAEHLGLPSPEDVRAGVMAFRIAAHAADVAKGLKGARAADDAMAAARLDFDWEKQFSLALDGDAARRRHQAAGETGPDAGDDHCSMCGKALCAVRTSKRLRDDRHRQRE